MLTVLIGCEFYEPVKQLNQGVELLEEGQYDQAITFFNEAIELYSEYDKTYYNRWLAYAIKGQYDKAIADFTKVIEINPKLADDYNNRGLAYYLNEQYDKVCSDWKRACKLGSCKQYELPDCK